MTVIKLKRSETASSVPTTSDLEIGEVALNTSDKKIYVRDSASNIVEVASAEGGSLVSLSDVTDGTVGQVLTKTTAAGYSFTNVSSALSGLNDVSLTSPQAGHRLIYNGSEWANGPGEDNITVTTAAASGGGSLAYDNNTEVFTFTPAVITSLGGTNISTPTDGQTLVYNSSTSLFENGRGVEGLSVTVNAAGVDNLSYNASTGVFTYTPPTFAGLPEIDVTGAADGQALVFNSSSGNWEAGESLGGISVTTNAEGSPALSYNPATGVFTYTPPNFAGLSDTNVAGVTDGQALVYDNGSSQWVPGLAASQITAVQGMDGQLNIAFNPATGVLSWNRMGLTNLEGMDGLTAGIALANAGHIMVSNGVGGFMFQEMMAEPTTTNDVDNGEVMKYDSGTNAYTVEDLYASTSNRIRRVETATDVTYTFL